MKPIDFMSIERQLAPGSSGRPLVLLFGSHLSTYAPTALPSGEGVTRALYGWMFPSCEAGGSKQAPELRGDFEGVPFEALMEAYPDPKSLPSAIVRMYGSQQPNNAHVAMVQAVKEGRLAALVTSNYDCALEGVGAHQLRSIATEAEWDAWVDAPNGSVPYLKLHGSAETGREQTLIFDLRREGRLEAWKQNALRTLLSDRDLVVVGFSGRDFDVCPALAELDGLKALWWLQREKRHFTTNAQAVIAARQGTPVLGDALSFLSWLFERTVTADPPPKSHSEFLREFREEHRELWRVRVLNRMGCRSIAEPLIPHIRAADPAEIRQLWMGMHWHAGRYRTIATLAERQAAEPTCVADDRVRWLLSAASGWLAYGLRQRSLVRLAEAEVAATTVADATVRLRLNQDILHHRITHIMRRAQVAQFLGKKRAANRALTEAKILERGLDDALERDGLLDNQQSLRHNLQRLGGARPRWNQGSAQGYRSLGLRCMEGIRARDWLRTPPFWFGEEKVALARFWLGVAERFGWDHESWKLRWLLQWRTPAGLRSSTGESEVRRLRRWFCAFQRVEYSPAARAMQLSYAVKPQLDPNTFDRAEVEAILSVTRNGELPPTGSSV